MPKSNILKSLELLEKPDIYSLLLFSIYKLHDTKEYSTLSELFYILNKDNLFNFLSMYGGMTITIPTVQEMQKMLDALLLYEKIHFDGMESTQALADFTNLTYSQKELIKMYKTISSVLDEYDFRIKRSDNE